MHILGQIMWIPDACGALKGTTTPLRRLRFAALSNRNGTKPMEGEGECCAGFKRNEVSTAPNGFAPLAATQAQAAAPQTPCYGAPLPLPWLLPFPCRHLSPLWGLPACAKGAVGEGRGSGQSSLETCEGQALETGSDWQAELLHCNLWGRVANLREFNLCY